MNRFACLLAVVASPFALTAQQPAPVPPPAQVPAAAPIPPNTVQSTSPGTAAPAESSVPVPAPASDGKYMLHDGDDVDLKFAQDISSKTATEGDPVEFVLAEDLKVGNVIVAKAGCKAVGEVTNAHKAGMMGKAGELSIRLSYLRVGETKVHIRGSKGKEGASGTGAAVALTVLFGPIGLIKHGHEIEMKAGTPLKAYVSDDTPLPPVA